MKSALKIKAKKWREMCEVIFNFYQRPLNHSRCLCHIYLLGLLLLSTSNLLNAQCNTATYTLTTGESYTLTAQAGLTNIQWFVDIGYGTHRINAPEGTTAALRVKSQGIYWYTATDTEGCPIRLCCPFTIKACPNDVYPLRAGESYTLTAQSGLTNIQWFVNKGFGKQLIPNATSAALVADTEGAYFYTATDADGCAIELCCPMVIKACPTDVYPLGAGESYTLTAQSGLTDIQWFVDKGFGKKAIPNATSAVLVADTEGAYSYTAKDSGKCRVDLCCPFVLKPCPTDVYPLSAGESYTLTAQTGLTNIQWFVDKGAGKQPIPAPEGNQRAFTTYTDGSFSYTATDAKGCAIDLCCPFKIMFCNTVKYPLCAGESYTITPQTGLTNIQWYQITTTGKQAIAAPRGTASNLVVNTEGVYLYEAKDLAGCKTDLCCPVRVVAVPPVEVTAQPNSLTECIGGTQAISLSLKNDGRTINILWQASTDSLNWTDISGATNGAFTPSSQTEGTYFYRARLQVDGFNCTATYSAVAKVQVVAKPSSTVVADNTLVCEGGKVVLNAAVTDATKTCTIQWQTSTNAGQTWTDINGANAPRYETAVLSNTSRFRVRLICNANGCCL